MNHIHSSNLDSIRSRSTFLRRNVGGFTLIELMVVIGIIIVLVGLTVTVAVGLTASSDKRNTELVLSQMGRALDEWESATQRQLTYGKVIAPDPHGLGAQSFDFDENFEAWNKPQGLQLLGKFLGIILRNPQAAQQLSYIPNDKFSKDNNGVATVLDSWDTKIQVVFPGRKWVAGDPMLPDGTPDRDLDGTVHTPEELKFGVCANGKIAFVSYGPDQKAGDLQLQVDPSARDPRMAALAKDNLSSYPLLAEIPKFGSTP
jgi:type II secretory pathway pseudopilin PulG